jgi:hypothetical protein
MRAQGELRRMTRALEYSGGRGDFGKFAGEAAVSGPPPARNKYAGVMSQNDTLA